MKACMGALRTLGLGTATAVVAAGLVVATAPVSHAADPVLPGPESPKWLALKKDGAIATDPTNDHNVAHLNLTPAGGSQADATAFVAADLEYAYFRYHVAAQPGADAAGGYVVQFDTDGNTAGWEQALRYDPVARTVTFFSSGVNSGVKVAGAAGTTVPPTRTGGTSYAGGDSGGYVAFAVPRDRLAAIGVGLGGPMVLGTTTAAGAGLDASKPLLGQAAADVLGTGNFGGLLGGNPAWGTLSTDPLPIDSDGDGVDDSIDNCPVHANPGQEDFDEASDGVRPPGENPNDPNDFPDGTEGMGDACDRTPYGYDPDGDGVGLLVPDKCPERPGVGADGCPAQSTTVAVLRYNAKLKRFSGTVRAAYEECVPRRSVTVLRVTRGPDKQIRSVRTGTAGRYGFKVTRKPAKGKYYATVDRRSDFEVGVNCLRVNSPKIEVR